MAPHDGVIHRGTALIWKPTVVQAALPEGRAALGHRELPVLPSTALWCGGKSQDVVATLAPCQAINFPSTEPCLSSPLLLLLLPLPSGLRVMFLQLSVIQLPNSFLSRFFWFF